MRNPGKNNDEIGREKAHTAINWRPTKKKINGGGRFITKDHPKLQNLKKKIITQNRNLEKEKNIENMVQGDRDILIC